MMGLYNAQHYASVPGPTAAAAAAAAVQALSPLTSPQGLLDLPAPGGMRSPFGVHSGAASEAWVNHSLPLRDQGSGFSTSSQALPLTGALLAAQCQQQGLAALSPLVLPEDVWSPEGSTGLPSATSNSAAGALSSGSYSLFEPTTFLGQLHEAATSAAVSSKGCPSPGMLAGSAAQSPLLLAPAAAACATASGCDVCGTPGVSLSGILSGHLTGLLSSRQDSVAAGDTAPAGRCSSMGGCLDKPDMKAAAHRERSSSDVCGVADQSDAPRQQQGSRVVLPVSDAWLAKLAQHLPEIAGSSGAELQLCAGAQGMQLSLQGTTEQVEAACKLLCRFR